MKKATVFVCMAVLLAVSRAFAHDARDAQAPPQAAPASPAAQAQEHHNRAPDDPFRLRALNGGAYALFGRGGNIGFYVGSDAVVVVGAQFKDLGPGIIKKIQSVTDKPIRYLVNTHHHLREVHTNPPAGGRARRESGNGGPECGGDCRLPMLEQVLAGFGRCRDSRSTAAPARPDVAA